MIDIGYPKRMFSKECFMQRRWFSNIYLKLYIREIKQYHKDYLVDM